MNWRKELDVTPTNDMTSVEQKYKVKVNALKAAIELARRHYARAADANKHHRRRTPKKKKDNTQIRQDNTKTRRLPETIVPLVPGMTLRPGSTRYQNKLIPASYLTLSSHRTVRDLFDLVVRHADKIRNYDLLGGDTTDIFNGFRIVVDDQYRQQTFVNPKDTTKLSDIALYDDEDDEDPPTVEIEIRGRGRWRPNEKPKWYVPPRVGPETVAVTLSFFRHSEKPPMDVILPRTATVKKFHQLVAEKAGLTDMFVLQTQDKTGYWETQNEPDRRLTLDIDPGLRSPGLTQKIQIDVDDSAHSLTSWYYNPKTNTFQPGNSHRNKL